MKIGYPFYQGQSTYSLSWSQLGWETDLTLFLSPLSVLKLSQTFFARRKKKYSIPLPWLVLRPHVYHLPQDPLGNGLCHSIKGVPRM